MAITYNSLVNLDYIYTNDGGVFSANNAANTAFDYFPDDAAVNDAIYFGRLYKFHNLKFYVGTAFAADSVTFVWEYWNGSAWVTLTVTDNTNSFTNLGENTIIFTPPLDWSCYTGSLNGVSYKTWIRCRISAITNPTEGGAQSTQKVQAGDNLIVVDNYTEGSPATFATIYNADVAESWGVVSNHGSWYGINASLKIGNANTTWLSDTAKFIEQYEQQFLQITTTHGNLKLGTKLTLEDKDYGINGCIYLLGNVKRDTGVFWGGNCYFYSGALRKKGGGGTDDRTFSTGVARITAIDWSWETSTPSYGGLERSSNGHIVDFLRCYISPSSHLSLGNLIVTRLEDCIFRYGLYNRSSINLIDVYSHDSIQGDPSGAVAIVFNLINSRFTSYRWQEYTFWAGSSVTMNLQYYFDLTVFDSNGNPISGAIVTMKDKVGTEVFSVTTDANGQITRQTVTHIRYYRLNPGLVSSNGSFSEEETTTYSPHTITISKPGYQTKTLKLTMDRKREEVEVLEKEVPIFIGKGKVLVNVDPKNNQNNILI